MCVFFYLITNDFLNFMNWGWLLVTSIKTMMLREKSIEVLYLVRLISFILRFISADLGFVFRQMSAYESSEYSWASG